MSPNLLAGTAATTRDDPDGWIPRVVLVLAIAPIFMVLVIYLDAAHHLFVLLIARERSRGFRAKFSVAVYSYAVSPVSRVPVICPPFSLYTVYVIAGGL